MEPYSVKLNFPAFDFAIKQENNKLFIFDSLRKKQLVLTPEEWVRQHLVRYLTEHLGYPKGLTQLEKKVNINGLPRRFDLSVMNPEGRFVILAECKAPNVELAPETVYQTAAYGKILNPKLYLITNGLRHICFHTMDTGIVFLENIPVYSDVSKM
jgi:hypothetical protein